MKPQITVYDEKHVKVGTTYPRRAKQLVSNSKAKWLDELHNAIELLPPTANVEGEITMNVSSGCVVETPKSDSSGTQILTEGTSKKKSIILDVYRDDAEEVLRSSPFEIIKKSKRRTRMLHISFSAVLWSGTLLVFFLVNHLLGNTYFTLNPREMSGTWLIFVVAALVECATEIFFSRKELSVLSESIDLRQINPNNDDLDLRGYEKALTRKIRIMYSAVVWIPLTLFFFLSGYIFGNWSIVWIVFLFGVFVEFLMHFIRKLKSI